MKISGRLFLPHILMHFMNIITKFTVATEEGMEAIMMLTQKLAIEKYATLIEAETLDHFIRDNYNEKTLISEINSLSNQWLVVYVDNQPAGYARMTSKGIRPEGLQGKKAICLADFGVLKAYPDQAIKDSLMEKCLSAGKSYENIWIHEYQQNPLLIFFEKKGFLRQQDAPALYFPLEPVCLIR